jgi:hypothetical protein
MFVTRTAAALALAGLLYLGQDLEAQSPVSPTPRSTPPAAAPVAALSPADEEQFRVAAQNIAALQPLAGQTPAQRAHALAERQINGDGFAEPTHSQVANFAAPYRQQVLDLVDEQVQRLQQQLKLPVPAASQREAVRAYRVALGAAGGGQSGGGMSGSASKDLGNGVTATVNMTLTPDWTNTPTSLVEGGGTMDSTTALDARDPHGLQAQYSQNARVGMGDRVDRCPSADGKVPGLSQFSLAVAVEGRTVETAVSGAIWFKYDATAEAHVGDDARIQEVVVHFDGSGQYLSVPVIKFWGDVTYDPHADNGGPVQNLGCTFGLVNVPGFLCNILNPGKVPIGSLTRLYLQAEKDWNGPQHCVAPKFTPPTDSVTMSPGESLKVKTELIATKDQQPTSGILTQLVPIPWPGNVGSIASDGTRTAPGTPGELTYTAPPKAWPCDRIPGFVVYSATSRAGAIYQGSTAWRPVPCLNLEVTYNAAFTMNLGVNITDHVTEVMKGSEHDGSVVIPLQVHGDGTVEGEAQVSVRHQSLLVTGVGSCPADSVSSQEGLHLVVAGVVIGSSDGAGRTLHLKLANEGPATLRGISSCHGAFSRAGTPAGARSVEFELPVTAGAEKTLQLPPPSFPHMTATGSWVMQVKLAGP